MTDLVFIGDAVTASGYGLAGADTRVPEEASARDVLEQVCAHAAVVLISASAAARVPMEALAEHLRRPSPLVLVVPDMVSDLPMPDMVARVRRELGVES